MKNFLKNIACFFRTPTLACECGGTIKEIMAWENEYYVCDQCGKNVTEEEFYRGR